MGAGRSAAGPAAVVGWRAALAWRMRRQRLVARAPAGDAVRVAGEIGGLHAQVMSSAELSLLARVDGLSRDAVRDALWADRSLVKLWAARGTLYLLPAAELGMWLAALGTYRKFGNGRPVIDGLSDAVGRALAGRVLTRDELADAVVGLTGRAEHGEWLRSSWGEYLKAASFRGLLCFGPGDGGRVRFTSPESWLGGGTGGGLARPAPEVALAEVTRRFLAGHGPTTAEQLARWWLGPPRRTIGERMLAALGDEVAEIELTARSAATRAAGRRAAVGERAVVLARDVGELAGSEAVDVVRLLPAFDPWVIGSARRPPLLDGGRVARVWRPQGWVSPVVLVNGRIVGVWRHRAQGGTLVVEVAPFGALAGWARRQVAAEAERLAGFLGHADAAVRYQSNGA
jgi:hypothetical protein